MISQAVSSLKYRLTEFRTILLNVLIIWSCTSSSPVASVCTNLHLIEEDVRVQVRKRRHTRGSVPFDTNNIKINLTNLVTASTTAASVFRQESESPMKILQFVKVCKASSATSLNGPARYGARKIAKKGSTTAAGSITSAIETYEDLVMVFNHRLYYHV